MMNSRYGMNGMNGMNGMGSGLGGYGSNAYGSPYGSTYGYNNGTLGYGLQPGMIGPNGMPLGPMGKVHTIMHGMESSVQSFGRISQLLHMNFDALYMSFSSILRFFDHAYLLKHEMYGVAQTFTTLKFLQMAYGKINRLVRRALGQDVGLEEVWGAAADSKAPIPMIRAPDGRMIPDPRGAAAGNSESYGVWGWIVPCLSLAILWSLVKWIWRKLFPPKPPSEDEKLAEAAKESNALQPVLGPDGKPVIGPDGRPVLMNPNAPAITGGLPGTGVPITPGMTGYGGGYGSMGGYGSGMYGSTMYGGMGSSMYGNTYGGLGSSMYGNTYGGYGGGMGSMGYGGGYGSSMYNSPYSSYGGGGGGGGGGMYGGGMY
jgi:hypothetical protein